MESAEEKSTEMTNDFDANFLSIFQEESREHLSALEPDLLAMEKGGESLDPAVINRVFRSIHTIKGGAGMLDLSTVAALAHAMENVLSQMRKGLIKPSTPLMDLLFLCVDKLKAMTDDIAASQDANVATEIAKLQSFLSAEDRTAQVAAVPKDEACLHLFNQSDTETRPPVREAIPQGEKAAAANGREPETIRVRVDLLNRLVNTAGELVLGRNQLLSTLDSMAAHNHGLSSMLQNLNRITSQLQEEVMQTRMQPIGGLFGRFSRMVRDLGRNLGKDIDLITEGGNVELDKSIIELLADPLTHIVRNSVDHGIETAAGRESAGKSAKGSITFKAYHEGGRVHVVIRDDGKGVNTDAVLKKAVENGLVDAAAVKTMSEREIIALIFAPGFSTAEVVSEVSGRGVGMDVVRTNIEKLGGTVEIATSPGKGTTVVLSLPLTVAIVPTLIVRAGDQLFAVPQINLVELVCVKAADVPERIASVSGSPSLKLRGALLPVVRLTDVLQMPRTYLDPSSRKVRTERRHNIVDRRARRSKASPSPTRASDFSPPRIQKERRQDWRSDINIMILNTGSHRFGLIVDELFDAQEVVVKPISSYIQKAKCFSGATILGNGRVIMIIDPTCLIRLAQLRFVEQGAMQQATHESGKKSKKSLILFHGSPDEIFAVAQEKILRIEKFAASAIQRLGGKEYINQRERTLEVMRLDRHLAVSPVPEGLNELYLIIPRLVGSAAHTGAGFGILSSNIIDTLDTEALVQKADIPHPGVLGNIVYNDRLVLFLDPPAFARKEGE